MKLKCEELEFFKEVSISIDMQSQASLSVGRCGSVRRARGCEWAGVGMRCEVREVEGWFEAFQEVC